MKPLEATLPAPGATRTTTPTDWFFFEAVRDMLDTAQRMRANRSNYRPTLDDIRAVGDLSAELGWLARELEDRHG